jgi:hypothetical protein
MTGAAPTEHYSVINTNMDNEHQAIRKPQNPTDNTQGRNSNTFIKNFQLYVTNTSNFQQELRNPKITALTTLTEETLLK